MNTVTASRAARPSDGLHFRRPSGTSRLSFWAAAAALAATVLLAGCGGRVELLTQTSEEQANEVLAALMPRGIAAEKVAGKEGKVSVQVPQERVAEAIAILQAAGLPRAPKVSMGDVFKKDGLISSPLEERARMVFALSQELSATIAKIDGVVDAEVHVVLPERGGYGEPGVPSSAAVFIKHVDTAPIENVVPQIRRLVANSISGLDYDRVSVVLVPTAAQAAAPGTKHGSGAAKAALVAPGATSRVLGIEVIAGSAPWLRALLTLLGALCVAAFGAAAWFRLRLDGAPGRSSPPPAATSASPIDPVMP